MKKTLSFAWFYIQLAAVLFFTLTQIAWIKISYSTKLFSFGCFLIIGTTIAIVSAYPRQTSVSTLSPSPPPHADLLVSKTMTKTQLLEQQKHYELLLQQQPHHRDILLNLALTHKALGDETRYQEYWEQARQTDPNNEIFE